VVQGLIGLFGAVAFLATLINFATGQPLQLTWSPSTAITLKLAGLGLATIVLGALGILWITSAVRSEQPRADRFVAGLSLATVVLFIALAVGIGYIRYFSTIIYSVIPSAIGGGRPQIVVFLLNRSDSGPPVAD
jgi:hypothetical protein